MARKTDNNATHYNLAVPTNMLKASASQYVGACGSTTGTSTGYPGVVSCAHCKPIAEADIARAKAQQARGYN